ncbi:nuclease SbcCD subunit C-like [Gigantopelta aegis]|uniref:nuclease SbcCD subunit C-like n=1 Tax=Gigantopelta aegis TaxID=1735272 RepID=UPI001B88D4D1|nr:nuclease SbcCD subunit C-like [Gigantopelta aegis]
MQATKFKTASLWKKVIHDSQTSENKKVIHDSKTFENKKVISDSKTSEKKPTAPLTTSVSTITTAATTVSPTASQKPKFNIHAVATSLMEKRKLERERELKVKQDEIDDLKSKHETVKEEKKKLQSSLDQVLCSQNDASQKLTRANDVIEKIRLENKTKTDQIEKMQGRIAFMEDRIRNLENRASEVEKAELTLESTKKILEDTIAQCRAKDNEIRRALQIKEDTEKQLEVASVKIKDLENKANDLKFQVRHELMKNENIEKDLETIPILKDDIREREKQISKLKSEIEEKSALLLAARKAIRDYKDKLRDVDHVNHSIDEVQTELKLAQCEVITLKNLMAGKNMLVLQKCRALELAKETIDCLERKCDVGQKVRQIQQILDNLSRLPNVNVDGKISNSFSRSSSDRKSGKMVVSRPMTSPYLRESGKENVIDVSVAPYSHENGHNENAKHVTSNVYFERLSTRPKTAVGGHRGPAFHEPESHSADSHGNMKRPGTCVANGDRTSIHSFRSQRRYPTRYSSELSKGDYSDTETDTSSQECGDSLFKMSHEYRRQISKMSASQKDSLLARVLNIGDRVSVCVPQKAPKYGRKKQKPIVYTGIVKYRGPLDKEYFDATLYVGVKLDGPIGDSDGVFKGKRYMFTPPEHGKFFKIRDVTAMLDIQSGHYEPMMKMMILQLAKESNDYQQV